MTVLLDANVLIALVVADHVHHQAAEEWWSGNESFATCPVTEGALVRFLIREGTSASDALAVLRGVCDAERHTFWSDELSYRDISLAGVVGHRQVTDTYLAELSRAHHGRLASLDGGLAAAHPDVVELVPSSRR
ncbi:MAG TPA: TA system VapC family ribonuclease toxin [Acidimicrobiales bacterium]|nr:TA system VapC family ribonuclease toxin [Acidimicrobiales bacterium]